MTPSSPFPTRALRPAEPFAAWRSARLLLAAAALALGAACSTPPPAASPPASPVLQQVAERLTDALLEQASALRGPPPAAGVQPREVLEVTPVVDARDRQSSVAAQQTTRWITSHLERRHPGYELARPGIAARWRMAGTLVPDGDGATVPQPYILSLALIDTANAQVVATARERLTDPLLDASFQAARPARPEPVAAPPAPAPAAPPPPPPVAQKAPEPDELDVLREEYLGLLSRRREAEAQKVFGRMLAIGLERRSVSMKLLFEPGSTRFLKDPELARRYPGWLAELARQAQASPHCLRIVGHASGGGAEARNRQLPLQRAQAVRQALLRTAPRLAPRLLAVGAPRAADAATARPQAADRRVEFEVVDCPPRR
jgi:outer membrane protein OmpA-like peptidoglycan-associated protein